MSELTRGLETVMVTPRAGAGVCRVCFNLTDGYRLCWACAHSERWLDAFAPISYSVSGGSLHALLADYKRAEASSARLLALRVAAVLWRYLALHERCVARAASLERFDLVTTVPSGYHVRDGEHPLTRLVGEFVGPVRDRHRRLLRRSSPTPGDGRAPRQSSHGTGAREFDAGRFVTCQEVAGRTVLLLDDTWTTGASAQSAAAALKAAGARAVAAVVIGRYLNLGWQQNRGRLGAMPRPFAWERCALESGPAVVAAPPCTPRVRASPRHAPADD